MATPWKSEEEREEYFSKTKVNRAMSDEVLLRQLGEESAELTHAVFKLLRTFNNENPTPITNETAMLNVIEEIADVCLSAEVFLADKHFGQQMCNQIKKDKLARWAERLKTREERNEYLKSQKATETSDLEEKIRKFENAATNLATQIAIDTARRLFEQDHGYMPDYPNTAEELLWIGNYAKEAIHGIANEILESDEPFEPITEVRPYEE